MSERYMQPLRMLIQVAFLLLSVMIAFQMFRFYRFVQEGGVSVLRPAAVDAFLPISGLFGTAAFLKGGGINPVHPAAVVVFITVLLVALLLRRSFCSWICPVGTVSELLWKLGFSRLHRNWQPPRTVDRILRGIKYLLMGYFVVTAILWPLSALQGFLGGGYHAISDIKLLRLFADPSVTTLMVLGLLLLFSVGMRNPFCRFLCPYGALLGLVALASPVAVHRNSKKCVSCGVCSQVCPAGIDVMNATRVNNPECLGCWRCISHCRVHAALSMQLIGRRALPGILFALLVVLLFWGGTQLGKVSGHWESVVTTLDYRQLLNK